MITAIESAKAQDTAGTVILNHAGTCLILGAFCILESRIVPGLYAAGEVLDVDGDCGGYNLQWAWASGLLAGQVLQKVKSEE